MRRFSRSSSSRNAQSPQSPPVAFSPLVDTTNIQGFPPSHGHSTAMISGHPGLIMNSGVTGSSGHMNDSRPISQATSSSFDFANRPISQPLSQASYANGAGLGLSRTDLIVLKHFWDGKYEDNRSGRDLHYLRFPYFPQYPSHKDLLPYCEIYHLIKTSPGAKIISLGTANGVYIGFELFEGSQLHIDMDDEWTGITHYRVTFKLFERMVTDGGDAIKSWPKPLTIEFLEEQYTRWMGDLMSICWEGKEVRELGSAANQAAGPGSAMGSAAGVTGQNGALKRGGTVGGGRGGGVDRDI